VKKTVRLPRTPYEKVWGSPLTEPWYRNAEAANIGEIWFTASESVPILVKFLFTSDNLSIQVHPGGATGKTEMWHILRAGPGAKIGLGLKRSVSPAELREAALTGEIVDLLNWIPVQPGETYFTPAGTIHALGGDIALCEIQQRSDITYRLYDWGRTGRKLHLDQGIAVSFLEPAACAVTPRRLESHRHSLVECEYFNTEHLLVKGSFVFPAQPGKSLAVVLTGSGLIDGQEFAAGETWEIEPDAPIQISSDDAEFLITSVPA
jgi:mannose-6-phosphate isomerase